MADRVWVTVGPQGWSDGWQEYGCRAAGLRCRYTDRGASPLLGTVLQRLETDAIVFFNIVRLINSKAVQTGDIEMHLVACPDKNA
jgi:hypothetical protein